ncbi:MAG: TraB/GumN family protein [Bacteroidetes bacterium]|nr:TraB/GumN family protein [Bacteroidota bacterium]
MRLRSGYLLWAILFCSSCTAQNSRTAFATNSNNNTLLWEITGKQLTHASYLFGTFHIICKEDIPFGPQLKKAVANVQEVYMELDMDDPNTTLGAIRLMKMRGDTSLRDLFTDAEYQRINSFFTDTLKMPIILFQKMKPFFLEALLYPQMLPCKATSGVEEALMQLAKENKKELKGLETMEFQASVFDSIPYKEQAKELLKSIDSLDVSKKYFAKMVNVYKKQELDSMETMFNDDQFGLGDNEDILLDQRNKNWIQQLNTIMKNESVFVAVGAGHLVGPSGLIALLRKEGYTVRPLKN